MDFDALVHHLGSFGLYQRILYALLTVTFVPSGLYNLGYVFLAYTPTHWCKLPDALVELNFTLSEQKALAIPFEVDTRGGMLESSCRIFDRNYSSLTRASLNLSTDGLTSHPCHTWEYDTSMFTETVVTKWNLVCSRQWMGSTIASVFNVGRLVGSIVWGALADRYGRKKTLIACFLIQIVSSVAGAFSPSYSLFVISRFLTAVHTHGASQIGFVLAMEMVGQEWRVVTGTVCMIVWSIGCMSAALYAWLFQNWVWLQLAMSIPSFLVIPLCFIPESPRWLYINGQEKKANKIIHRMAEVNKVQLADLVVDIKKNTGSVNPLDILRTPNMRRKTFIQLYIWIATAFTYYGLSYNTGSLYGDPYINYVIACFLDIVAFVFVLIAFKLIGRRCTTSGLLCVGGLALLSTIFIPNNERAAGTVVMLAGRTLLSAAFTGMWVYSTELYPTLHRTTGLGICSMVSRFGAIMSSYVFLLASYHYSIPAVLFGVSGILGGVLALCLPETRGVPLPESMEEAEERGKDTTICSLFSCCARGRTTGSASPKTAYSDVPADDNDEEEDCTAEQSC